MNDERTLFDLRIGDGGVICAIDLPDDMRRRVQCLGLTVGSWVVCYAYAPFGDPGAYRVLETTVALRKNDAKHIYVRSSIGEKGEMNYGKQGTESCLGRQSECGEEYGL